MYSPYLSDDSRKLTNPLLDDQRPHRLERKPGRSRIRYRLLSAPCTRQTYSSERWDRINVNKKINGLEGYSKILDVKYCITVVSQVL